MSFRRPALLAALAAPAAVLALVPVAGAARPGTDLRLSNTTGIPSAVTPGGLFTVRTTVANRGARRALTPKVLLGLTRGTHARPGAARVATRTLPAFRPGRATRYALPVRLSSRRAGSYRLVLCVTQRGRRARCVLGRRMTIARPTPPPAPAPAPRPAPVAPDQRLRDALTPAVLLAHTDALATIAAATGSRADGTQGYDDAAAYVLNRMAGAGLGARIGRFDLVRFTENAPPVLTSSVATSATPADIATMTYSGAGDSTTRPIVPVDLGLTPTPDGAAPDATTSGCEAGDFGAFTPGDIALVKRGTCSFAEKARVATAAGASALIIMNEGQPGREATLAGTLEAPVVGALPVIGTSAAVGEALAAAASPTGRVVTDTTSTPGSSYNLLFDTPGGDPARTVVVGAHLDGVPTGPGINDNGSGVAFVLALAEQLKALGITPRNRVRFAFWGAGEVGLAGSRAYVEGLAPADLAQVGLYLDADTLASPNAARLVLAGAPDVERAFRDFYAARGAATRPVTLDGRSDHAAFQAAGVPVGGVTAGGGEVKPADQVPLFGGTAGVPYDPNHHGPGDGRDNVSPAWLKELADGTATVALGFADAEALPARAPASRAAAASVAWRGDRLRR